MAVVLVGVLMSRESHVVRVHTPSGKYLNRHVMDFLVYNFRTRSFTHMIYLIENKFLIHKPGTWFRLLFSRSFDLDRIDFTREPQVFIPHTIIVCQRRVETRCIDGQVNFSVQASLKRLPNKQQQQCKKHQLSQQANNNNFNQPFLFRSRLGDHKLSRHELIDCDKEMEEEEDDDEAPNNIPDRVKLWCAPCRQDINKHGIQIHYNVTRIDERIWYSEENSISDRKEREDPGENSHDVSTEKVGDFSSSDGGCNVHVQMAEKVVLSSEFSQWFSNLIQVNFERHRLTPKRRVEIENFIDELQKRLRKELKLSELKVNLFGSVNSGFGSNDCDLDLCLTGTGLSDRKEDILRRRKILTNIERFLQHSDDFDQIIAVLDARTPIVKFEHTDTGFVGDISVENSLAIYNTELLLEYTKFDTRLAPLGFALKRLAKIYGINNASTGSISSYAYIVMLIYFLQRCKPCVLPYLQNEQYGRDSSLPKGNVEGWSVAFPKDIADLIKSPAAGWLENRQSMAELLHEFLFHFCNEFTPEQDIAQIRKELWTKEARGDPNRRRLCVEDPFDLSHNLTSGVRTDTLNHILNCFRTAQKGMERYDREHFHVTVAPQSNTLEPSKIVDFSRFIGLFKCRRVVHVKKKKNRGIARC